MSSEPDIQRAQQILTAEGLLVVPDWKAKKYFPDADNDGIDDQFEKRVELDRQVLAQYETAGNRSRSIWTRLRAFFGATSKAGRYGKAIIDFALLFIPFGKTVQSVTEFVTERFIKSNQKKPVMLKENFFEKALRYLKQPSTRTGLTVLITLITGWFSFDLKPEVFLSSVIGIITGLSGIYAGIRGVQELFKDEDERGVKP